MMQEQIFPAACGQRDCHLEKRKVATERNCSVLTVTLHNPLHWLERLKERTEFEPGKGEGKVLYVCLFVSH